LPPVFRLQALVASIYRSRSAACDNPLTQGFLQLALKHRQNKTQRTRIIAFVCSPVVEDEKSLISLAGKLKKNNVSVDFVLFGDLDDETQGKLEKFNEKVKSSEGCHLVVIPPSGKLLSDQLISTPIMLGENAPVSAPGGGGVGSGDDEFNEFGFDPATDPELALVLRMSMMEEKERQEKRAREEAEAAKKASLETVKEVDEASEQTPLLDKSGEASGSGSKDNDKKARVEDDKMDES
jgi:26S proteasome regulatory subunit N10